VVSVYEDSLGNGRTEVKIDSISNTIPSTCLVSSAPSLPIASVDFSVNLTSIFVGSDYTRLRLYLYSGIDYAPTTDIYFDIYLNQGNYPQVKEVSFNKKDGTICM